MSKKARIIGSLTGLAIGAGIGAAYYANALHEGTRGWPIVVAAGIAYGGISIGRWIGSKVCRTEEEKYLANVEAYAPKESFIRKHIGKVGATIGCGAGLYVATKLLEGAGPMTAYQTQYAGLAGLTLGAIGGGIVGYAVFESVAELLNEIKKD